jgi:diguanylate cyclase (GGDEF)-like protein
MDENLRKPQQHRMSTAAHLEDALHCGLGLPVKGIVSVRGKGLTLESVTAFWLEQVKLLPSNLKYSFFVTDNKLNIVDRLASADHLNLHHLNPGDSWAQAAWGWQAITKCAETGNTEAVSSEEHDCVSLRGMHSFAAPIYTEDRSLIGILGMISSDSISIQDGCYFLHTMELTLYTSSALLAERTEYEMLAVQRQHHDKESKKRDVLFEAAKKLHAKIDVDSVLSEVIDSIKNVYPSIQVDLLLSQDSHSTNLPVKPLNFQSLEDDLCTRAFMEGHLLFEPIHDDDLPSYGKVAAPLSGKQGVYGVLHLHSDHELIDATDIQFISMLADTAGSAFENAKLYEQSNLLINELRLINEITKRLNMSLRLNEIFNFASSELLSIFGADYCCILQTNKENERLVVQASNLPVLFNENFSLDEGFSGVVYATQEPIIISDYWANAKIKSKLMDMTNSRSLIASPITVNGEVVGVILVVHSKPNFFSYDNYKLLQVLSGHIGLAMTNASLHAEVRRMVITDNLTGLYVRHFLDEQINLLQKKDYCGSLIVVDIDNFKKVNDTYGHQIGDKILIEVSQIIKTSIRDIDVAARWGGEELAVYLPQVAKDQTLRIAEAIRQRVMNETNPQVTVSCGLSDWNWEEEKISVESLFYRADMALYQAKHSGRNQVKIG